MYDPVKQWLTETEYSHVQWTRTERKNLVRFFQLVDVVGRVGDVAHLLEVRHDLVLAVGAEGLLQQLCEGVQPVRVVRKTEPVVKQIMTLSSSTISYIIT